jgi:selenocysteine-specific translation elongation factor
VKSDAIVIVRNEEKQIVQELLDWINHLAHPELLVLLQECGSKTSEEYITVDQKILSELRYEHVTSFVVSREEANGIDPADDD